MKFTGNVASGGNGGPGGAGGPSPTSGSTGGLGGSGNTGGHAKGGGFYASSGTNTTASTAEFKGNEAFGGGGGGGGFFAGLPGGHGGNGGSGGVTGEALGGALYADGAVVTLANSVFSDVTVPSAETAAEEVAADSVVLQTPGNGGNFTSGGQAKGGAIYTTGGANVTLDNSQITNSRADGGPGNAGGSGALGGVAGTVAGLTGAGGNGSSGENGLGGGLYVSNSTVDIINGSSVTNNQANGGQAGTGGTGSPNGSHGSISGSGHGGGIYQAGGGSPITTITGGTLSSNSANGAIGLNGQNGASGATSGLPGADGVNGGEARGGAIYTTSGTVNVTNSTLESNSASGGLGGSGGTGGISFGTVGAGGNGGNGGMALGGGLGVGTTAVAVNITSTVVRSNSVTGGNGGSGGSAGTPSGAGQGGNGGTGGLGAFASGGGLYADNGSVTISGSTFDLNTSTGGTGGNGGQGGDSLGTGGNGGAGGNSDGADGGGIGAGGNANLTVSDSTIATNTVAGANGGTGGAGGDAGNVTASTGGVGGNGGTGGLGGEGAGGGLLAESTGMLTISNSTVSGNNATSGNGGSGGNGGDAFATEGVGANGGDGGESGGAGLDVDGGLTPSGLASDGEVEDYEVTIETVRRFLVNATGDGGDAVPGDGICNNGSGDCTLRAALDETNALANLAAGVPDIIEFSIPGVGPHTIQPGSPLPTITDPVVIDGTTEPDYAGTPVVELDGSLAGAGAHGLLGSAGGSAVRGLAINRFAGDAVKINLAGGNLIEDNALGTDPAGTLDLGNSGNGVTISGGSHANVVRDNLISGNNGSGVVVVSVNDTLVQGNLIGTSLAGSAALANSGIGVFVSGGSNTKIGGIGSGAGNVISGNSATGISTSNTTGTLLLRNLVGTDISGAAAIPNGSVGVFISGGTGTVIGGLAAATGNVISGNTFTGMTINSAANTIVQQNFVGTDITGGAAVPNSAAGMLINSGSENLLRDNVISGNASSGVVVVNETNLMVLGNRLGTDAAGTTAVSNNVLGLFVGGGANNTIGGSGPGDGNVMSGNLASGVALSNATSITFLGNRIGTDITGAASLGNGSVGFFISGGSNVTVGGSGVGEGNVVADSTFTGITLINASTATFQGNRIGTDLSGGMAIPNAGTGLFVFNSTGVTVGGTAAGAGNVISARRGGHDREGGPARRDARCGDRLLEGRQSRHRSSGGAPRDRRLDRRPRRRLPRPGDDDLDHDRPQRGRATGGLSTTHQRMTRTLPRPSSSTC